jgi:hypothetical protein
MGKEMGYFWDTVRKGFRKAPGLRFVNGDGRLER